MADTPKKTRTTATKTATTAKPRKAPAKKAGDALNSDPVSSNGRAAAQERSVSQEEVARLAHSYWQQRGRKHGQHEDDWYRAEQELRGKAS